MFNINDEMNIQIKDDKVKIHIFSRMTGESTDKIIDLNYSINELRLLHN